MNTELAKLVYKQITEFPESFDMHNYMYKTPCGTVACLAGHALLLSGYTFTSHKLSGPDDAVERYGCSINTPEGVQVSDPVTEARKVLDLSDEDYLGEGDDFLPLFFDYQNALDRFRDLIEKND